MLTSNSYSQNDNIENLFKRKHIPCADIRYNAQYLIAEFYEKNDLKKVNEIIEYWEKKCGTSEEITRSKILIAIADDNFKETNYDNNILKYIDIYIKKSKNNGNNYDRMFNQDDLNLQNNEYDSLYEFTIKLAKELLRKEGLIPIEKFFLLIYSNDYSEPFDVLKTKDFDGTLIQKLYLSELEDKKNEVLVYFGYLAGVWIPQGNLKIVGNHPFVGFRGGIKYRKLNVAATIGFRGGQSPNVYQVFKNDSIYDTDHFFGGYIGLDLGFEMFRIKKSGFDLIGGIALDGIDVLSVDDPNSEDNISKTINSLNLNIGLGYKLFIRQARFISVEFKYNIVNYENNMGTDLSGNTYTINIIYGFSKL